MGEHALKAGIGYAYLHEDVYIASTHPRVFLVFRQDQHSFGLPGRRRRRSGEPVLRRSTGTIIPAATSISPSTEAAWNIHANNYSAYIQDSWTIKNRLTLNIGIRAESQYIPAFTDTSSIRAITDKPVKFDLARRPGPPGWAWSMTCSGIPA